MTALPHHSTAWRTEALLVGHRPQRLPGAAFRVANRSVAFTKRGQYGDRQTFEPALPVGRFFAPYRLRI